MRSCGSAQNGTNVSFRQYISRAVGKLKWKGIEGIGEKLRGKHLNSGIRGGLWEDEHFQRMGPSVWLFGWLVHRQTRERHGVGLVLGGSPLTYEIISQDTGIAPRTLKRWMARLVCAGYVCVTHTAHKRMVIQISKAKKFGPQQLRFPQGQGSFPQIPFFAPKSKGPLPAPEAWSKGPASAREVLTQGAQPTEMAGSCDEGLHLNRENKPERKKTETRLTLNSIQTNKHTALADRCSENSERCPSDKRPTSTTLKSNHAFTPRQAPRTYPSRYGPDRKLLRDLEILAELRVGAGPEIHRE